MRSIREFIDGGYRSYEYLEDAMFITFNSQTEYEGFKDLLCKEFPRVELGAMEDPLHKNYIYVYNRAENRVLRGTRNPGMGWIVPAAEFLYPEFDTDAILNFITKEAR